MSKMNSTINSRYVFDNARQMLLNNKVDPTAAFLTQGELRVEQQVSIARTQYQFEILNNDNVRWETILNQDIRLTKQAAFFISVMVFFLVKSVLFIKNLSRLTIVIIQYRKLILSTCYR